MNVFCNRKALVSALSAAIAASFQGSKIADGSNLCRIERRGSAIHIGGTDCEVWIEKEIECREGSRSTAVNLILFDAKRALAMLREGQENEVEIRASVNGEHVTFYCGRSKIELATNLEFQHAKPKYGDTSESLTISAKAFFDAIGRVIYARGDESATKFTMQGILLETDGTKIFVAATDGKRLAVAETKAEVDPTGKIKILIPGKTAKVLQNELKNAEGNCILKASRNTASLEIASGDARTIIETTLIEGNFPPHQDVIRQVRKNIANTLKFKTESLLSAIRQSAAATDSVSTRLNLSYEGRNDFAVSTRCESANAKADCQTEAETKSEPFTIAFCSTLIPQVISAASDEGYVTLCSQKDNTKAVIFEASHSVHMLMPLS